MPETYTLAYARVSTDIQATDDQALTQQLDLLERAGYQEIFTDIQSGRDPDRPQFLALVERALELSSQGRKVEILVVELQRWARNMSVGMGTIEKLAAVGVSVREVSGGVVSIERAADWLSVSMRSLYAEYFSRDLSDRVRRGNDYRRRNNRPLSNRPAWGYRLNSDRSALEPNPEQWPIARGVIEHLVEGESLTSACLRLYQDHGVRRHQASLRQWLMNPVLRGHLAYSRGGLTKQERKAGAKKAVDMIYNTHPALMSDSEFATIRARLDLNSQLWGANKGRTIHAVPSIVVCGVCGRKATIRHNAKSRYFRCGQIDCSNRMRCVRADAIEAAIQEAILESAEMIAAALLAPTDGIDPRIAAWEAEIVALRPMSGRPAIAAEIEAIELEIAHAKTAQGHQAAGVDELREKIKGLGWVKWSELPPESRRLIYGELIERVVVEGGDVVGVVVRGVG